MASNIIPLQCTICVKTFSGPKPASQHFQSGEHKKKEANAQRNTGKPYCDICHITCDTMDILMLHKSSPRHQANLEKKQSMNSGFSSQQNAQPAQPGGCNDTSKEYVFDGKKGYCYLCRIDLTSKSHARDHINGQKHLKKKVQVGENIQQVPIRESYDTPPRYNDQRQYIELQNGRDNLRMELITKTENKMMGQVYRCDVCDKLCTSPENLDEHLKSEKHKKAVRLLEKKERGEDLPLSCNACGATFTGQESAADHFNGKKHKRNVENMQIQGSEPATGYEGHASGRASSDVNLNREYKSINLDKKVESIADDNDEFFVKPFPADTAVRSEHAMHHNTEHDIDETEAKAAYFSSFSYSQSLTDEAKIRAEMLNRKSPVSFNSGESRTSNEDNDCVPSRDDQPIKYVKNNLFSSLPPSFGRGRGFLQFAEDGFTRQIADDTKLMKLSNDTAHLSYKTNSQMATEETERKYYLHNTAEGKQKYTDYTLNNFTSPRIINEDSQHVFGNAVRKDPDLDVASLTTDFTSISMDHTGKYQRGGMSDVNRESQRDDEAEYCFSTSDGTGRCNVCRIDLTSVNHKRDHLAGRNHAKAKVIWTEMKSGHFGNNPLICIICLVSFTGFEARDQHFKSAKHIAKERQAEQGKQDYFCSVCHVPCSGEANYRQHLAGAQHRKMAGVSEVDPLVGLIDRTVWYSCEVCSCKLNSPEQLSKHKRSPRHLAKLQSFPQKMDSADMFKSNATNWYPCHVCDDSMETLEQLRSHERSQNHLLAVNKQENSLHTQLQTLTPNPYGQSCPVSPLENFLAEELFPAEFLPGTVTKETASRAAPFIDPVISSEPVPSHIRFADAQEAGLLGDSSSPGSEEGNGGGSASRGQGSDLAWATRSRGAEIRHNKSSHSSSTDLGHAMSTDSKSGDKVNPYAATHPYYCHTCKAPANTKESYESHLKGKRHLARVCTEQAPSRHHLASRSLNAGYKPYTCTQPRRYQTELFNKAMTRDTLCFLPTGTGKTQVAVMTISAMLDRHPSRNVLFLVDKVLLVIQQSKYIRHELEQKLFTRFDPDKESCTDLVDRKINVAAVCMGQQSTGGVPLWKHDVVVVTAAFCQNLLDKEILRWEDFSLVVFDEAHHCEKSHPFNALLRGFHNVLEPERRPKILGLTASPAGKDDVPKTLLMLQTLVQNMGGVHMGIVQDNVECLDAYQSNATLVIRPAVIEKENIERQIRKEFCRYITYCFLKLKQVSNIRQYVSASDVNEGMSDAMVQEKAEDFVEKNLDIIQSSLNMVESIGLEKVAFSLLTCHVQFICMALNSLDEGGPSCAMEEINEMQQTDHNFLFAENMGLPCGTLRDLFQNNEQTVTGTDIHVSRLINEIVDMKTEEQTDKNSIILVLVKQRSTAHRLTRILQESDQLRRLQLNTTMVVGHGGGGAVDKGMSVPQQKRALEDIKQFKYQVIIATSVAEEGVDWPECERVISMYPPSTVTALVQMRGRARRKNSKFIVICSSPDEETKLMDILKREKNMKIAAALLAAQNS